MMLSQAERRRQNDGSKTAGQTERQAATLRHVPGKQLKAKSKVPSAYNTRQEPVDQPLEAGE